MIKTKHEYWDEVRESDKPYHPSGPGIVGDTLADNVYDNPNWVWREYGQRAGVWRMFEIFEKAGVPTTCTMNAKMGLKRREVIDYVNAKGWKLVTQNVVQSDFLANYAPDIEGKRNQPYPVQTRCERPMVCVPDRSEVNDFTVFIRQGKDVNGGIAVFKKQCDEFYREGPTSGRLMNTDLHPQCHRPTIP